MKLLKIPFIFALIFSFTNTIAQTEVVDTTDYEVFVFVEVQPEYIGGDSARLKYLYNTIKYPNDAMESEIHGTVYISFIVEKDGSISKAKVLRGVSESIDKESLRAINGMPNWKPGFMNGKAVRCQFNMPIKFEIISDPNHNTGKKDTFLTPDNLPYYIGGDEARLIYLSVAVVYPEVAKENGEQGSVYVNFIVEKDGSITNAKVLIGVSPSLDKAALKAIMGMPKWKPAQLDGKDIRSKFVMPIKFILS